MNQEAKDPIWEEKYIEDPRIVAELASDVQIFMEAQDLTLQRAILEAIHQRENDHDVNGQLIKGAPVKNSGQLAAQIIAELELRGFLSKKVEENK